VVNSRNKGGENVRRFLLAITTIIAVATISPMAHADMVGAAAGAGTGLVVAGPVGAVPEELSALFSASRSGVRPSVTERVGSTATCAATAGGIIGIVDEYRNRRLGCSPEVRRGACGCAQKAYLTFGTSRLGFRVGCFGNSTQRELGQMSYEFA
jgi:hypothetical protein